MSRHWIYHVNVLVMSYRLLQAVLGIVSWYLQPYLARQRTLIKPSKEQLPGVTIVCATIGIGTSLKSSIQTWVANSPSAIIIVTAPTNFEAVTSALGSLELPYLRVMCAPEANKRVQLSIGFRSCLTDYVAIADDDTIWSRAVLRSLTEPFLANNKLGAVYPEVKFRANGPSATLWEELAAIRLSGDCFAIRTSVLIDGGIFCASGTTALYRTAILQDERFLSHFQNKFYGRSRVNAGDDQTLNSWLCSMGWDVTIVEDGGPYGCHVLTTPRADWRHVHQLVRWSRSDWLSYTNAICVDRRIIWRYPFTALWEVSWCLESFAPVVEVITLSAITWDYGVGLLMTLTLLSRLSRYLPDAITYPRRFLMLPVVIPYVYLVEMVKLYALLTVFNTEWA
ncbi:hypothetical protein F5B20DRAFT_545028 [Whalleya microplaca]|nr:hypothetical protein F5B20DRAFT_545028 [Whalleya microplaca]